MVQRSGAANVANVEVNNNTYIYYLMNSTAANGNHGNGSGGNSIMKKNGELLLTDVDSIDSGTCSDNSQKTSPIPPALPKKQSVGGMMMTKIVLNGPHHDSSNSYSDSDESDTSLSSLGSNTTHNSDTKLHYSLNFFPDSLLKDIRDHSINTLQRKSASSSSTTSSTSSKSAAVVQPSSSSKITIKLKDHAEQEEEELCQMINTGNLIRSNTYYDADKYYNFHINERDQIAEIPVKVKSPDLDETFAGYKELHAGSSTIRSAKGTVRGVKNRVRNGIATFLQIQQHTTKNYKEKDAGKVIVYTTSMGIVRKTFTDCANVKKILKTLLVKYEERDIFMSGEYQQELRDRLQCNEIKVPQLFVDGQCIGDAAAVETLNETGELRKMLKPYKCLDASATCPVCGGFRLLPCSSCGGSKKSIHRNNFTREFVALKCMNCDEVGLVRCPNC